MNAPRVSKNKASQRETGDTETDLPRESGK